MALSMKTVHKEHLVQNAMATSVFLKRWVTIQFQIDSVVPRATIIEKDGKMGQWRG